jgi:N-hydroxyarylamine O-acetyltransferase
MVLRVTNVADVGRVLLDPPFPAERDDVWLADVGFGGIGLLEPMPLRDGAFSEQGGLVYRLRRDDDWNIWVLSMRDAGGLETDLYEFSEDPQTPGDVAVANHYTSTHPESIFRKSLTIQRATRAERTVLRSEVLTRYRDGKMTEEPVARERLADVARDLFGVALPAGPLVCDGSSNARLPPLQRT